MNDLEKRVALLEKKLSLHTHIISDGTQPLGIPKVYMGAITSTTTGSTLESNWIATVNGSNLYTITHNLGRTDYAVVALPASFVLQANLITHGASTFTIEFDNSSGTAFATNWDFILKVKS